MVKRPHEMSDEEAARLRTEVGGSAPTAGPDPAPAAAATAAPAPAARSFKTKARGLAIRALNRLPAHRRLEAMRREVATLNEDVRGMTGLALAVSAATDLDGLVRDGAPVVEELQALRVNLELLKGELRALTGTIEDLGFAIAPGAGLAGVPARFAELRERVEAIDRRVRIAAQSPAAAAPEAGTTGTHGTPGDADQVAPGGSGLDYVGLELRFRGDSEAVLQTFKDRYFDLLVGHGRVLDVGCGRGELVAALAAEGVDAMGVEIDAGMAAEARERGVDVVVMDAVSFLRSQPEHSFGVICAMQVVEHLDLRTLVETLELAVSRLQPGGILIAETPNPATLIVLGNSYILDPTHVWPLHPSLLTFLCERAGFRDVRLRFFGEATDYQLPRLEDPAVPAWAAPVNESIDRLNRVLFGPQDYAVVATTPA